MQGASRERKRRRKGKQKGFPLQLVDAGLTRKLLHKIAREHDAEARADFLDIVHDYSGGDGEEFVFVDEMSKNDHDTARRYGRSLSGQRADFVDKFV